MALLSLKINILYVLRSLFFTGQLLSKQSKNPTKITLTLKVATRNNLFKTLTFGRHCLILHFVIPLCILQVHCQSNSLSLLLSRKLFTFPFPSN